MLYAVALLGCARDSAEPGDSGSPPASTFPDQALGDALQSTLDAERDAQGSPGATLTVVIPGTGTWSGASGAADLSAERAVSPDDVFGIGSITKTFVATVILELDAEGVLSIDDVASTWIPDAPYADEVTLRQLLSHTSGLADFDTAAEIMADPGRVWEPEELLAFVADQPLLFSPGSSWAYSNAGFVELALVIEAATGESYADEIHERIIDPLGLAHTFVPTRDGLSPDLVRGYFDNGDDPADVTEYFDPTATYGCGEMESSGADLVAWADALYGGQVLDAEHLEMMTSPTRLNNGSYVGYGLACDVSDTEAGRFVGHSGQTMGFTAQMTYLQADGRTTASLFNDFVSDAGVLDEAAWGVLTTQ